MKTFSDIRVNLMNMTFSWIPRRKRHAILKWVILVFVVSCIVFWCKQVWNVSVASFTEGDEENYEDPNLYAGSFKKIVPARNQGIRLSEEDEYKKKINALMKRKSSYTFKEPTKKVISKSKDVFQLPAVQILAPDKLLYPSSNKLAKQSKVPLESYSEKYLKVTPGLGENGAPVYLSKEEQKLADKVFNSAAFNVYISDRIALNRSVPDPRNPLCKYVQYDKNLPSASVIIIFTNEAWSALLRTIYSVFNRTPVHLLREIILVDDFSDKDYLKHDLEEFLAHHFPRSLLKLHRLKSRQGLIRARLAGAKMATGDVLVFLDSHCETNTQWLEPLLQRIKEDRTAVLCPIIDVIDDKTLEYYANNKEYFQIGGFTWSGHFTWIEIPEWEEKRRKSAISSTRSPTMAGGLFAIDRNYFWEIGSYDSGMDIWGGENLEMSFRVWMCGGTLEIVPCSHVGHIFRGFHPYVFPGNKDTHGINTVRTVEAWMDDYKKYFYMYRQDLADINFGDVSDRINFKKKFKCKPFSWYLENVYRQKFIFDMKVSAYGSVKNPISNLCLDILNRDEDKGEALGLYYCKAAGDIVMNQMFSFSNGRELRREENCAEVDDDDSKSWLPVLMTKCHGKKDDQEWMHKMGGQIIHVKSGKCLDTAKRSFDEEVYVTSCNGGHTQIWWFENYKTLELDIQEKL